jgi:hypothetical protein
MLSKNNTIPVDPFLHADIDEESARSARPDGTATAGSVPAESGRSYRWDKTGSRVYVGLVAEFTTGHGRISVAL